MKAVIQRVSSASVKIDNQIIASIKKGMVVLLGISDADAEQDIDGMADKIKNLRGKYQDVKIGVDGGINLETAPMVIKAGANLLAAGTAIFKSDNIEQAIKDLKKSES